MLVLAKGKQKDQLFEAYNISEGIEKIISKISIDRENKNLNFLSSTQKKKHCRLVYCKSLKTGYSSINGSIYS